MTADQVLDRTALLLAVRNAADAELTRTVRKADTIQAPERDGHKTMRSWLRNHLRLSARECGRIVGNGRALEQLPAVAAAFAAGAVTAEQVSVIAPVAATDVQAEAVGQGIDLAEIDALLADVAATQVHAALGQVVQHFLDLLDPDGDEPDPTEQRALSIARHADGSVSGRFELDAVGGEKVCSVLESFVQADRPKGDLRTRAQQQGDALVQWADVTLAAGRAPILRTVKPHVVVTDLRWPTWSTPPPARERPPRLRCQISAARARMLACDGNITRIVSARRGSTLDVGRTKRVFPPRLRRAVEHRDQHCVFAGCDAPSYWCDVHSQDGPAIRAGGLAQTFIGAAGLSSSGSAGRPVRVVMRRHRRGDRDFIGACGIKPPSLSCPPPRR